MYKRAVEIYIGVVVQDFVGVTISDQFPSSGIGQAHRIGGDIRRWREAEDRQQIAIALDRDEARLASRLSRQLVLQIVGIGHSERLNG